MNTFSRTAYQLMSRPQTFVPLFHQSDIVKLTVGKDASVVQPTSLLTLKPVTVGNVSVGNE